MGKRRLDSEGFLNNRDYGKNMRTVIVTQTVPCVPIFDGRQSKRHVIRQADRCQSIQLPSVGFHGTNFDKWELNERGEHDFIIRCQGRRFKVFKSIITRSIKIRQELDADPNLTILNINYYVSVVHAFLQWLYFEQTSNIDQIVADLYDLSVEYEVSDLKEHCIQQMISALNELNVSSELIKAFENDQEGLKQSIVRYSKQNGINVVKLLVILMKSNSWIIFSMDKKETSSKIVDFVVSNL